MAKAPLTTLIRALVASAFLAAASATSPALAHAVLLKSDPQDGQVLATSPKMVTLTFNEPVQMTRLQSVKSDGTVVKAQQAWPLADTIAWTPPDTLADGGWLLSYSVISSDSHPISGTIRFVVGDGEATFGEAPSTGDGLTEFPRFLLIGGTLAATGLLFAGALFRRRPSRRVRSMLIAALIAVAAGSVGVIWATAEAAGGGDVALTAALNVLGPGTVVVILSLAAGIALAWLDRRRAAALAGLIALVGLGVSGHVGAAPPEWLSRPVYVAHVTVVALWLGSLLLMVRRRTRAMAQGGTQSDRTSDVTMPTAPAVLGGGVLATAYAAPPGRVVVSGVRSSAAAIADATVGESTDGGETLVIFSRLAPWMIAILIACGVTLLTLQAGNVDTLVHSTYGQVFGIKLLLVAVLLGLAAYNRWRLTRPALAGDARSERRLRVTIVAELALFVPILAVTALLGTAVPPRALAAAAIPPCSVPDPVVRTGSDIGLNVTLTLRSACSGRNNIALALAWQDGKPLVVQEVLLQFSQRALNVEPFDVYLDGKDGKFGVANYDLPLAGEWLVEARILLDEYTLRRVVLRVPLVAPGTTAAAVSG